MKHYKNAQNQIYAFEDDGSQDAFIPKDLARITDEELAALRAPTPQQLADAEKAKALADLAELDRLSIRALREYVASKTDAPQLLKDREALAQAARLKLK